MKQLVVCFILSVYRLLGSDGVEVQDTSSSQLNYLKLGTTIAAGTALFTYSQLSQASQYWSQSSAFYFNFANDWTYAHGADKFGHALAAGAITELSSDALHWCGIERSSALWIGAGVSMFHQSLTEIRDGYSTAPPGGSAPYLGFSWGDMVANLSGAAFPVARHYISELTLVHPKYSLNASEKIRSGGFYSSVFSDYESEYHWLSIDVYEILPIDYRSYWSPLLCVALGHSVKNIVSEPGVYSGNGYHELWLSLDYNLEALPGDASWWKLLKKYLNLYKLPAPCIRLLPDVVFYGFRL